MTPLDLMFAVRDLNDPNLSGPDKSALFGLVSFRERDGKIAPSLSQLATATGMHRATVLRALQHLAELGYLTTISGGKGRSSRYELDLSPTSKVVAESNHPVAESDQSQTATGSRALPDQSQSATGVVAECDRGGSRVRPSGDLSGDLPEDLTGEREAPPSADLQPHPSGMINKPNNPTPKPANKTTKPKPVLETIPKDWQPPEGDHYAAKLADAGLDVDDIVADFVAHWASNGAKRADWPATFANNARRILRTPWMLERYAAPSKPSPNQVAPKKPVVSRAEALAALSLPEVQAAQRELAEFLASTEPEPAAGVIARAARGQR